MDFRARPLAQLVPPTPHPASTRDEVIAGLAGLGVVFLFCVAMWLFLFLNSRPARDAQEAGHGGR